MICQQGVRPSPTAIGPFRTINVQGHFEESSHSVLLTLSWELTQGSGSWKVGVRTSLHFSPTSGGRPETQKQQDWDNIILMTGTINTGVCGKAGRAQSCFSGCREGRASRHCPSCEAGAERGLLPLDMGIRSGLDSGHWPRWTEVFPSCSIQTCDRSVSEIQQMWKNLSLHRAGKKFWICPMASCCVIHYLLCPLCHCSLKFFYEIHHLFWNKWKSAQHGKQEQDRKNKNSQVTSLCKWSASSYSGWLIWDVQHHSPQKRNLTNLLSHKTKAAHWSVQVLSYIQHKLIHLSSTSGLLIFCLISKLPGAFSTTTIASCIKKRKKKEETQWKIPFCSSVIRVTSHLLSSDSIFSVAMV